MNQKNIFTGFAAALILQGIVFYFMGTKIMTDSFPNLDEKGTYAATIMIKVLGTLSFTMGLISYAVRNNPQVLWAYTIGMGVMCLNTLKDLFIEHLNVPIPAILIQVAMVVLSGYLWYKESRRMPV